MQVKQKALTVVWVDEAGRGSWAGPVYAAAFLALEAKVTRAAWWKRLADSKTLSEKAREFLFSALHEAKESGLVDFEIAFASSGEIDRFGIKEANRMAMSRALAALASRWRMLGRTVTVDGNDGYAFPELGQLEIEFLIRGDSLMKAISAASILAKVARDACMTKLSLERPEYGFETHKGYGTKKHADALKVYWPTSDHRASYEPIKNLLSTPKDLYFPS